MYNYEGTKNNMHVYTNVEPGKNSALGTVRVWGDRSGSSSLTYGIRWNHVPICKAGFP